MDIIRFNANPYSDILIDALSIVRKFIVHTESILVGGMSIDIALKQVGHQGIYSDNEIPDYDFLHHDSVNIAYDLAVLLINKNIKNVNVISAIHTSTMKVRVATYTVADITYSSKEQFDKIKYIQYKGMKVAHPIYSIIDQMDALTHPYHYPPLESINYRLEKDITRFNLLINNTYHISDTIDVINNTDNIEVDLNVIHSILAGVKNYVFSGIVPIAISNKYTDILSHNKKTNIITIKNKSINRIVVYIHADSKWWNNVESMINAKHSDIMCSYYNSTMNYSSRVEILFNDNGNTILELVNYNYKCIIYKSLHDIPIDIGNGKYGLQQNIGVLWNNLIHANLSDDDEEIFTLNVLSQRLINDKDTLKNMSVSAFINDDILIPPSLQLSLERHRLKMHKNGLVRTDEVNKNSIYLPTLWTNILSISSKPTKFKYEQSHYFTMTTGNKLDKQSFINNIANLEDLSKYFIFT